MPSERNGLLGPCFALRWLILSCGLSLSCRDVLDIQDYGARPDSHTCGADGACGAGPSGEPMTCFAASQLGGEDYCVEACDVNGDWPEGFECVSSGALLQICEPGDPDACPAGLACFRSDISPFQSLLYPERQQAPGLCIAMPVCSTHADCADEPLRRLCGGQVLRERYPELSSSVLTDHLQCVQACAEGGLGCPSGEGCLTLLDDELPEICVPNCEAGSCPPNSYCLRNAGPGYPPMCIPGLPGFRCGTNSDCMIGYCANDTPEVGVCTIACESELVCGLLSSFREPFFCLAGNCASKSPFAGALCQSTEQCPSGQVCSRHDPYHLDQQRPITNKECHPLCNDDGRCDAFAGVPYVCLPNGECYPGDMGLPCKDEGECMGELTCEAIAGSTDNETTVVRICTEACKRDVDCVGYSSNPKICRDGFCQLPPP
jgi:hypothetical protein